MKRETLLLGALSAGALGLAAAMAATGRATWLEASAFVTGAICVWLVVRENVWNFPIGLINVATFSILFFQARLYADAGLQVVYFALGLSGWYLWLHGGERRAALRIQRASRRETWLSLAFVGACTVLLWRLLRLVGGSASFFDALTTSGSLASQWLLNKKRVENWLGWILVDILYVPLYLSRGLHLTAVLYAVFLAMATTGYLRWRALLEQAPAPAPAPAPAGTP